MTYPYQDLREYLATLDELGLLQRVTAPVNKDTQLVPLVRLQFRGLPAEQRRAFLFENVTSADGRTFDAPVAIASFAASRTRLRRGARHRHVDGIGAVWGRASQHPSHPSSATPGRARRSGSVPADLARTGGIDSLPHPISTPGFDPAPFLTAAHWVTSDPDNGMYNVGVYRGMIKGARPHRTADGHALAAHRHPARESTPVGQEARGRDGDRGDTRCRLLPACRSSPTASVSTTSPAG